MVKRASKFKGAFWSCSNWPMCDIICKKSNGGYEFTDQELRTLRRKGHAMAEKIWGEWAHADKKGMYAWMKKNTATGHFSSMNKAQCQEAIDKLFVRQFEEHV